MKKTFFLLLFASLGISLMARAADPGPKIVPKGQVLEFGLFELVGAQKSAANPNSPDGSERTATGARFIAQTNRVPATLGTQFGFRYKITGVTEEGTANLKTVVIHPPVKNAKGEGERRSTTEQAVPAKDGVISEVTGYSLERPEELVPGAWIFELWYHGQRVVTQSFTAYALDDTRSTRAVKEPNK